MSRGARAVLWAGAVAGVLDISAAIAFSGMRGVPAVRALQSVASGLLGPAAYTGGAATAALGLALHFVIAYGAAAVYYAASRWRPILVRHAVVSGLLYGVVVYLVMNRVVLPLSRVNFRPSPWPVIASMIVIHMLCVGLPIALAVRRFAGERDAVTAPGVASK